MPSLTFYPTEVKQANGFTLAELGNVVGNTTAEATVTQSMPPANTEGGTFLFDLSAIPPASTIQLITGSVIARCVTSGYRDSYQFDVYTGSPQLKQNQVLLTNTNAQYDISLVPNASTASIIAANTEWTWSFISKAYGTVSTAWQKFWITVDYTLPSSGVNPLFMGENF